ncbi:uncharacterized protein BDZ99DRAFT_575972 [Mytilinidion resinicola]|uniref:Uncharacterized protein n=1 Tax=Mytilinidion resinicola TaxID=574789 RepID=A0A6A6Y3W6_9PEZI|nr:uncharacterized protein BDZ99DRAFT_575972 [Mytilinidion resinicola]KAF2803472.1 hypothetical protein BDZ99DRAFT_575972 [Mytilinidion resinicola]
MAVPASRSHPVPPSWSLFHSGSEPEPAVPFDPEDLRRRLRQVKLDEAFKKAYATNSDSPALQKTSTKATWQSFFTSLRFHRANDAEHQRSGGSTQPVHSVKDSTTRPPPIVANAAAGPEKHELHDTRRKDSRTDASTTTSTRPLDAADRNRNSTSEGQHPPPVTSSSGPSPLGPTPANSSRPIASWTARSSPASSGSSFFLQVPVLSSHRTMASMAPSRAPMSPDNVAKGRQAAHDFAQQRRKSLHASDRLASRNSAIWSPASPPPVHYPYANGQSMFPEPPSLSSARKKPRPASTGFEQVSRPAIVVTADDAPPLPRLNRFSVKGNLDWDRQNENIGPRAVNNSRFAKGSNSYEDRLTVNSLERPYYHDNMSGQESKRSSMGGQYPSRIVSGEYTLPGPPFPTSSSSKLPPSAKSNRNSVARSSTVLALPSNSNRNSVRYSPNSVSHHPRLVKKDSLEQHRWREKTTRESAVLEARARRGKEKEGGGIGMGSSPVLPSLSPFPPLSMSASPAQGMGPQGQLSNDAVGRRGSGGVGGMRRRSGGNAHITSQLDRRTSHGNINGNIHNPQLDRRMSNSTMKELDRKMSNSTLHGTNYSTYPPSSTSNGQRLSYIQPTPGIKRASTAPPKRLSLTNQASSSSLPQTSRAEKRGSRIISQHAPLPLLMSSPDGATFPSSPPRSQNRSSINGRDQPQRLPYPFPQLPPEPVDSSSSQEARNRGRRRSSFKDDDARKRSKSRASVRSTKSAKSTKSQQSVKSTKSTRSLRSIFSTASTTSNRLQKRQSASSRASRRGSSAVSKEHLAALAALTGPAPPPDGRMTPQSIAFLEKQKRTLEERQRRESVAKDREERMERLKRGREMEKVLSGDIIGGALGGYREGHDSSDEHSEFIPSTEPTTEPSAEPSQAGGVRSPTPSSLYSAPGKGRRRYTLDDPIGDLDTSIEGLTPESIRLLREREKLVRWRAEREKQLFEQKEREREERVRAANEKEAMRMVDLEKEGKGKGEKKRGCFAWWPFS